MTGIVENRIQLERTTAAYFDGMTPDAQAEEQEMSSALCSSTRGVDFDLESGSEAEAQRNLAPAEDLTPDP